MAQAAVNAVIQAFQRGMEQVQQAHAQKQQREEFESNLAQQKAQFEAEKTYKESEQQRIKDQFEATNKVAQGYLQLQEGQQSLFRGQSEYDQAQKAAATGIFPSGTTQAPVQRSQDLIGYNPQTGSVNQTAAPGQQPGDYVNLQFPSGHSIQIPSVQTYARQQAGINKTLNEQDIQDKVRLATETGRLQLQNQLQLLDAQYPKELTLATIRNQWDKEKIATQQAGENYRANLMNSTRLKIAGMAKQGLFSGIGGSLSFDEDGNPTYSSGDPTNMLSNLVPDIASGKTTQEDLQKLFPTAKDRTALGSILTQAGVKPINNKQRDYINDLQSVSTLLPRITEMYQELNDHPYSMLLGLGGPSERFKSAKETVEGNRALLVRVLEGVNRYTHQQAVDKSNELIPDVSMKTVFTPGGIEAQNEKYKFFVKEMLQDNFTKAVGHLSPSQQKAVRGRIDLPDIGQMLSQPGGEHPQTTGTTSPQVLNNPQPTEDRVIVYDRKTGKTGSQLKKFVDKNPSRYTIMGTPKTGQ